MELETREYTTQAGRIIKAAQSGRLPFASDALQLGADLTMIGRLLGHTQVQTTARYAHLKTDPVRTAANKVAEFISSSLSHI